MYNSEQKKKYQFSSEFGLYRYRDFSKSKFSFRKHLKWIRYIVIVFIIIITLTIICIFIYQGNDVPKSMQQTISNINSSESKNSTVINGINTNDTKAEALPLQTKPEINNRNDPPRPFTYDIRDPKPIGFKLPETQSISVQKHRAKNIQEIIKFLTGEYDEPIRHKVPKKQPYLTGTDPFFPYKPHNPSDVNLLATNNFRFASPVQLDSKKPTDLYPKYERPLMQQTRPVAAFDFYNSNNRKPIQFSSVQNYQNPTRARLHPLYSNKYNNFYANDNVQQTRPKKKRKLNATIPKCLISDDFTEETNNVFQIKNATVFNELLQNTKYRSNKNIFRIKHEQSEENHLKPEPNVEISKSIGFTIAAPNFEISTPNGNDDYVQSGTQVESNVDYSSDDYETVTLPLPMDSFQKHFITKPALKYNYEWDLNMLQKNPNLINHRAYFTN